MKKKVSTKDLPLVQRVAILLEVPSSQDSQKEYDLLKQAYTDLMYGIELEPDISNLIQTRLEDCNI